MAQINLDGSTWIDINSLCTRNSLPDRLPDEQAIVVSSLYNLLGCPIGGRSRTFQPPYGTITYRLLQEPIDQQTATQINLGLIQAINRWEPRIALNYADTWVRPVMELPGFRIRLSFTLILTGTQHATEFSIRR